MKSLMFGSLVFLLFVSLGVWSGEADGLKVSSPDFLEGGWIPAENTGTGSDLSPQITWSEAPEGTKSFALIADDPDAPMGTWIHWVIFNIPAEAAELEKGLPSKTVLADGSIQGVNSFGTMGYGGPMPPPGPPHRYFFKLYALDTVLELRPGATAAQLEDAMKGHILATAEMKGIFGR